MNKLFRVVFLVTTAATLVSAGSAKAAIVGYVGTSDGIISQVNLETGEATPLVNTALDEALGDIAISNTGVVYANSLSAEGGNNFVYKVNVFSKKVTPIGDANANNLAGLAFNTDSDQLFGSSFAQGSNPGSFYSLDTSTGLATLIAQIPNFSAAGDIAYNPNTKTFFATSTTPTNSTLFSIALDGTAQEIGDIGFENVYGLIYTDNTLYGLTSDGQQLTLDTSTGVGTFKNDVTGLAADTQILGASPAAVPEPITILGSLTAIGFGVMKRKLASK